MRQEDFHPVVQIKTKRNALGYPLLKEFLGLDQLWSIYTKYVLEAVYPIKDRKVQIQQTSWYPGGLGLQIPI